MSPMALDYEARARGGGTPPKLRFAAAERLAEAQDGLRSRPPAGP